MFQHVPSAVKLTYSISEGEELLYSASSKGLMKALSGIAVGL